MPVDKLLALSYSPQAKCGPLALSVNKVLLEHSHTPLTLLTVGLHITMVELSWGKRDLIVYKT